MALEVQRRILSRPARVEWAGFSSDTYRLQQAGWELAAEEDVCYGRIRLLMRHQDMRLYAMCRDLEFDYYKNYDAQIAPQLRFDVIMAAPEMRIREIASMGSWNFKQIDATPTFVEDKVRSIEDLKIFSTPLKRTEEIIVEPQSVQAMLDKIREMQAPEQARLRAKQRMQARREGLLPDETPQTIFHAQIISLAERRAAA